MIIGINDLGLHAILRDTKQMQHSFKFDQIEWVQKKEESAVEVKIKSNGRLLLFRTKQVDMLCVYFIVDYIFIIVCCVLLSCVKCRTQMSSK